MVDAKDDALQNSELGFLVSATLHKLEHISDHHVKERRKHFRITNLVVSIVSGLLFLIAVANMYYLYDFYNNTMRIISTTHTLDNTVLDITRTMDEMKNKMVKFNQHMASMPIVYKDISGITAVMPEMQNSMSALQNNIYEMNKIMRFVNRDIQLIDFHLHIMTRKVSNMGVNMFHLARPMGMFNGILP
ncbi:MAG: hypothetical protein QM479_15535 [Pseudomonadota bacterium]